MIKYETINYILRFLCTDNTLEPTNIIEYCRENEIPIGKRIIIIKSEFFDENIYASKKSLPQLPLKMINGLPLLFGDDRIERHGRQIILYADLIASTFFLISRYEETVRSEIRDRYGRFPGLESLPNRAGFIDRPIVDEYGRLLRSLMREVGINVKEPEKSYSKIYLTHDIDTPWERFSLVDATKLVLGNLRRKRRLDLYPIRNWMGYPEKDPQYTFEEIISLDKKILEATTIYFIKSGGNVPPEDGPIYIHEKAFKRLKKKLTDSNAILGYHVSFEAGQNPNRISEEIEILQKALGQRVLYSRNHYLLSKEPADFYKLINSGITDDFTMGYADLSGFRLGTARSVRWVDPYTSTVTSLNLHPLTIMDVSLFGDQYMALFIEDAKKYSIKLLNQVKEFGGELSLLWHNTSLIPQKKEVQLYSELLSYLSIQKDL